MVARHHPNIHGLIELARRDGKDIRPMLIRVLADLYVQETVHTQSERARFTELVCRLLDGVDSASRMAVAQRLAPYRGTPAVVASMLARDEIAVAEPILRRCPALGEAELHAILDSTGPAHATAIAARIDLPKSVAERLTGLARIIVEKPRLPAEGIRKVSNPASNAPDPSNESAAAYVASQIVLLAAHFLDADAEQRRLILSEIERIVAHDPAFRLPKTDPVIVGRLERAALTGRRQEFAFLLERALGLSPALAVRIVVDRSEQPMMVICRTFGLPFPSVSRILLFLNSDAGQSVEQVSSLADRYEAIGMAAAHCLVAFWCASSAARSGRRSNLSARQAGGRHEPAVSDRSNASRATARRAVADKP